MSLVGCTSRSNSTLDIYVQVSGGVGSCYLGEMFERIRTIKGHRYRFLERRWREGGKVRSQSWSLGPVDGAVSYGKPTNLGHGGYQEQMAVYPSRDEQAPQAAQSPAGASSATSSGEQGPPSDQE